MTTPTLEQMINDFISDILSSAASIGCSTDKEIYAICKGVAIAFSIDINTAVTLVDNYCKFQTKEVKIGEIDSSEYTSQQINAFAAGKTTGTALDNFDVIEF